MVLYKRKQVTFVRPPSLPTDLSTEVYVIPQTKEWFLNYEDYLNRMDYYYHRKFVCEITGNSCLTFFEAYESELREIKDVEKNFPEALREHLLRFLQFNRLTRLDQLVDKVYLVFKSEYFPGEEVYIKNSSQHNTSISEKPNEDPSLIYVSTIKQKGVIREKVQYSNPLDTKYLVATLNDDRQIIATNEQISRDRNNFTKWLIKTFVKLTVTRSHKVGAPWVVKEKFAKKYRIPNEYPEDLKHFESSTPTGNVLYEDEVERSVTPLPSQEPVKGKKQREKQLKKKATLNAATASSSAFENSIDDKDSKLGLKHGARHRFLVNHLPAAILKELEENDLVTLSSFQPSKKTIVDDLQLNFDLQACRPTPKAIDLPENAKILHKPIIKRLHSEVEGLEKIAAKNGGISKQDNENITKEIERKKTRLKDLQNFNCIQEALECWTFLNIYHSVLKIDTFTFDDFLCAMSWNSEQVKDIGRCELLDEIWCAVLGAMMSNEIPKKDTSMGDNILGMQIVLPSKTILQMDEQNDLSKKPEGKQATGVQDSIPKQQGDDIKPSKERKDKEETESKTSLGSESETEDIDEKEEIHNAYSVMDHRGIKWYERLRKRNFKDGNWQSILLGVLSLVEYVPAYKTIIEEVYETLAPTLINATPSSVLNEFYAHMSLDLRLRTLHILTCLLVNGSLVRDYIDKSLDSCATSRRARLDIIRDLKVAVDGANKTHTLLHDKLIEAANAAGDSKVWALFNRKKARFNIKTYEMTDYERELSDSDESFRNLWNKRDEAIERIKTLKASKKEVETKFTEMDCQRVRLLGKDRLFNRYWWFENNGLPNLHYSREVDEDEDPEPESDIDEDEKDDVMGETYLMGRLWVQGPSTMDMLLNIKVEEGLMASISSALQSTISQETYEAEHSSCENIESPQFTHEEYKKCPAKDSEKTEKLEDLDNGGFSSPLMNFSKLPDNIREVAAKFGVEYRENSIHVDGEEIIDSIGGIPKDQNVGLLTPIQRKFIEEIPEPLVSGSHWRFYDQVEQIETLLKWLNPWGKRESQLRKELLRVKEGLTGSINKRRKALWLDQLPKDAMETEEKHEKVKERIAALKEQKVVVHDVETDDSGDDIGTRKRHPRRTAYTPNKRQKTMEEALESGSVEELQQLSEQLKLHLREQVADNHRTRVLEWVNSAALESLDRSLYEGGDKVRARGKRPKK